MRRPGWFAALASATLGVTAPSASANPRLSGEPEAPNFSYSPVHWFAIIAAGLVIGAILIWFGRRRVRPLARRRADEGRSIAAGRRRSE